MLMMRKIPTFFWEYRGREFPDIDLSAYRLQVHGDVAKPSTFALEELGELFPVVNIRRRFYCVNGWSLESEWSGYKLADLMRWVEPHPSAKYLRTTSLGGYEDTTALETLLHGDALLVTHMNGDPLPVARGKPLRLMVFHIYQFKGVKALARLEVVHDYRPGTWAKVGYSDATIQPYPHLAIDKNAEQMPEEALISPSTEREKNDN